jgi:hypothetical protein
MPLLMHLFRKRRGLRERSGVERQDRDASTTAVNARLRTFEKSRPISARCVPHLLAGGLPAAIQISRREIFSIKTTRF